MLDGTVAFGAQQQADSIVQLNERALRSVVTSRKADAIHRSQTAIRRSQIPDPATSEAKGWFIWLGWSVKLGCYFCLLMCLIKDHGFEPKPEKAEKFYRFEVDHWTHITKAADRKRPQEGGFLGCFEKPPVSYFPAQKLTWKLKNDPLRKGSSFTHYPFFGFRFSCRRCI